MYEAKNVFQLSNILAYLPSSISLYCDTSMEWSLHIIPIEVVLYVVWKARIIARQNPRPPKYIILVFIIHQICIAENT